MILPCVGAGLKKKRGGLRACAYLALASLGPSRERRHGHAAFLYVLAQARLALHLPNGGLRSHDPMDKRRASRAKRVCQYECRRPQCQRPHLMGGTNFDGYVVKQSGDTERNLTRRDAGECANRNA